MELNSPTITSQHLVCTDSYCPKATDAFTNRVICRCYQTTHGQMPFSPNFAAALFHTPISGEIPSPVTSPMQANPGLRWDNAAVSSLGFGSPFLSAPHQNIDMFRTQMYNYLHSAVDPNNGRRKNATRETTTALKAWLKEHRKNPYPTKAEKIMLAIITRMTLTQVSTWFANARRRLKKENKGEFSSDISFDDLSTSSDDEDSTKSDSIYKSDRIYKTDTTTPEHELPGYSSMSSNIYNCGSFTFRPLTSTPIDHNMNNLPAYTKPEIKMENDNSVHSNVDKIVKDGAQTGQTNDTKDQNDTKLTDNNSESSSAPTRPRFLPPLISKPKIWSISNIIGNGDCDSNLDNNNEPTSDSETCGK